MKRLAPAGIPVEGLSIGGLETCIALPGLRLAFDVGRCPPEAVRYETLLFTHAHMDHMGGIAYHAATRALRHLSPPTYVVPPRSVSDIGRLFEAWRALDRSELPHAIVPLEPGGELELRPGLVVRPFHASHTTYCQGYVIWTRKHKLKPEYRGLGQEEIRRLRVDRGIEVTEPVEVPEVAFTGDTRIEAVVREEALQRARLLVLETTFLDERVSVEECRAKGHVHLDEVVRHADLFRNEAILMTHFSARYRADEVVALLDARLPPGLRERVVPLLAGFESGAPG